MNEDFVTYEQAVKLKELGFDWECQAYFEDYLDELNRHHRKLRFNAVANDMLHKDFCSAPTLAQTQKWLRESKGIFVDVFLNASGYGWELCKTTPIFATNGTRIKHFDYKGEHEDSGMWLTYEQALSAGIDRTLELLKEQNNGNQD